MLNCLKIGWKTGREAMGDPQRPQMILPNSWWKKEKKQECRAQVLGQAGGV